MVNSTIGINVVNMSSQPTTRSGAYTIKVPFSSLSRTMQFIHRSGGKVIEVMNLSAISAAPATTSVAPTAPSATAPQSERQPAQDRSKQSGKQTKK
jgi:hypothetical protein